MVGIVVQILAWTVFFAALVLWPAGTLDYAGGWAFVVLFFGGGTLIMAWMC